jgi:Spy/CpxP family protein refolding chaperone
VRIPVWVVAATIIVVSLLTGVVVGVAVDRRMHAWPPGHGMRFQTHRTMVPGHLEHELGLSPAQSAAVDSIMRYRMGERDSLIAHTWPRMRQLLDSTRSDIERVLTPEQREKFEKLRSHGPPMGGQMGDRMGGHMMPPEPPPPPSAP